MSGSGATVALPRFANEWVNVEDDRSRMHVRFALQGAAAVAFETSGEDSVAPGALAGADVFHHVTPAGAEDYVLFESAPLREAIEYDLDVSRVAGLRLVSSSLEFLEADGTPRLRIAPPFVIDTHGVTAPASLHVEGCAFDANAAAPWHRPVVSPGASSCTLRVTWTAPSYPLLVDPAFTTTGSMVLARARHTATMLTNDQVLLIGGTGLSSSGAGHSAELYDPTSGTFASTGEMKVSRLTHSATRLSSGKVLVVGGHQSFSQSEELYDPALGTFSVTGTSQPRDEHTATLLSTGKVLLAGGDSINSLQTAVLYDPALESFTATGSMAVARTAHTATLLPSGKVLIVGGSSSKTAELYDPGSGKFASVTSELTMARSRHAAVEVAGAKVLFAGGGSAFADVYDIGTGTFTQLSASMPSSFSSTRAAVMPSGSVLLVSDRSTALYDPVAKAFRAGPASSESRWNATLSPLSTGRILVAGGETPVTSGAELFAAFVNGTPCTTSGECDSNQCVDGVCCNVACEGRCQACDTPEAEGTCATISGKPHGERPSCEGSGACAGTCDGSNATACSRPPAGAACGSACHEGVELGRTCNESGDCIVGKTRSCNNLVCADERTCKTSCASDVDCVPGFSCHDGACTPGRMCVSEREAPTGAGTTEDCSPYRCVAGGCRKACVSVDDCLAPNVCNGSGQCVPPPVSAEEAGCQLSRHSKSEPPIGMSFLFLATAWLLRRRRS